MAAPNDQVHIDDTKAKAIGQEISSPNNAGRLDAMATLSHVSSAEMKAAVQAVDANVDKKSLGLTDFHLDGDAPLKMVSISADPATKRPALDVPALTFTSTDGKHHVVLLSGGSEYDAESGKQIRQPDATDLPAAPAAPTPEVAAPATPTPEVTAPATPAAPTDANDPDRAKVALLAQAQVDASSKSLPIENGEGYFQVLQRMHPEIKDGHALAVMAHQIKHLNGDKINLKHGDTFDVMTPDEKAAAFKATMANYDSLPADQKATILAQAKKQFPDQPAPATPAPETPAPVTPAPETPAPVTPAPETPAPVTPAPETPAPVTPAPETPAPVTPAPETPAPVTPAPETPAPVTPAPETPLPTPTVAAGPSLDPTSAVLNPTPIDASKDKSDPDNQQFNPLLPRGLTEGGYGKNLTSSTSDMDDRTTTAGKDSSETLGRFHNWHAFQWYETHIKSDDTYKNGKLDTRTTTYDDDRVNMTFQTNNPSQPAQINGVRKVESKYDDSSKGYNTYVTDGSGKIYQFTSDADGNVTGYTKPS